MFGGFGRGPGPAPAGDGPSPSPCLSACSVVAGLSPPHPPFVSGRRFGDTPLPAPPQGGREKCGNKASFVASLSRVEMLTHPLRGPCDSRSSESGVFFVRQGKNVPPTAQEKEARKAPCVGRKQP